MYTYKVITLFILIIFSKIQINKLEYKKYHQRINRNLSNDKVPLIIIMWYDDKISNYADLAFKINSLYCQKYNYKIIKSKKRYFPMRKPHWERLPMAKKYLPYCNHLMYIDADAFFYYDSGPITNIINKYYDSPFIFSNDCCSVEKRPINTGVFIVKNCEYSYYVLDKWMNMDGFRIISKLYYYHFIYHEQSIINAYYKENKYDLKNNSTLIKYNVLQSFGDKNPPIAYIRHLAGTSNNPQLRYNTIKTYLDIIS